MRGKWLQRVLRIAAWVTIALAVMGWVVMTLWNLIVPAVFGWRAIGFWQALGLLVLSKILFGGLRGGWKHGRHRGLRERWEQMTPEQREESRRILQACCGHRSAEFGPAARAKEER